MYTSQILTICLVVFGECNPFDLEVTFSVIYRLGTSHDKFTYISSMTHAYYFPPLILFRTALIKPYFLIARHILNINFKHYLSLKIQRRL